MTFTKNKNKSFDKRRKTQRLKNHNNNDFQKMNCSPAIKKRQIRPDSCFTPEIFMTILKKYNEKNPNEPILEMNLKKAWTLLKNRLSCKKEECWLQQLDDESMREQIKQYIFAPKHPPDWNSNPDEWLSNFDIGDVAAQYEVSYPEFKLIGPTTIDFDTQLPEEGGKCVLEDLCNFSLQRFISAKKTKIGIVLNLDKHDQGGSHWVSLYIDIQHRFIFFFDSADNGVPKEVWIGPDEIKKNKPLPLANRIMKQGLQLKQPIRFTFYSNDGIMHQQGDTECGMYSLFFIITMLTGKTPFTKGILSMKNRRKIFLKSKIPDKVMFKYRKLYFND